MKAVFVKISLIVLVLAAGTGFYLYQDYQSYIAASVSTDSDVVFEVKKGSSFNAVAKKLSAAGYNDNPVYLKLYARHHKLSGKIKAGEYQLNSSMTPKQVLEKITSGRSINYSFTIVEGSTFKQVRAALGQTRYLSDDISKLGDGELLKQIGISQAHPEGLFLAETYNFQKGGSALALLKRANQMLTAELEKAWQNKPAGLPYKSAYEALIMASIVEKETGRPDERPVIAGVFTRRLEKRMRLQTDPTVIYGMGDAYKGNIRRSDLRRATPYNTYVIPALPPTPIAMVGREAIDAALNPAPGKALYFVAKGDGSHYFSASLKEHNRAVQKYQLTRRKDYRSSP